MADGTALQLMSTGTSSIPPIGPRKLVERESEITKLESAVLYPRLVLLEALTRFKDGLKQRAMSSDKTREARRDFLDSFAYLCDVEKGGKTVTATALQMMEVETGDCLWLAANEGIREEVLFYAQKILKRAKAATVETLRVVQDRILTLSVKKCRPRIHFYRDAIKRHALQCNEALECVERDDVVNLLRTKLGQLLEHPPSTNLEAYVDLCYGMRGEHIRAIRSYSKTAEDGFSQLAHHIYRLGATRDAANKVVEAMTLVPSLQKISKIQIVNTPRIVKKTVSPPK
ncbi:uncharacterized protein J4E78_005747 [Alternaria triticimaculans]|uniref:uncharacterized protein n=1 Tax=Alternaria triticimaculans TaxID=297637 RepID=UPI0020C3AF08|nr:uncharacterized protein J4E78_005747 [Alternaria triticimaculans]KAI4659320.1 hypothetical protein J4E78_005747 [Alternaria triticimaculans]